MVICDIIVAITYATIIGFASLKCFVWKKTRYVFTQVDLQWFYNIKNKRKLFGWEFTAKMKTPKILRREKTNFDMRELKEMLRLTVGKNKSIFRQIIHISIILLFNFTNRAFIVSLHSIIKPLFFMILSGILIRC